MQAAFAMWQLVVQLAVRAPTSGSPASSAAKRCMFSGVVAPVLQILLVAWPAAHDKPGSQISCLWPQVPFFLFAFKPLLCLLGARVWNCWRFLLQLSAMSGERSSLCHSLSMTIAGIMKIAVYSKLNSDAFPVSITHVPKDVKLASHLSQ